ncbi:chromosomal replication initiator protein : Chromosomal replication initiator protein dnaA OS=uncultured Acidobacteria bacterium A2 PE=3 SV=1: Bac_DnaA: Bac_DnaA_C [Gemmata massiliana]|uniref:Chromosomal replication initiator protein DnaA n=1 Tax=Gemmata massiliana TaxID=1210884 RepID=A0A6P2DPQ1_9BACT|nr:chromosomal replication initiator protein DnaA [Gemmata massiliana]VTS03232.1 chromosomal replication initiator protein : Chromosomal replication initiator protein dnaA OS=uncultured Acidobacteria bacterium A2 PE=3 SV=1: Bac_DnaA: Bac_DnaA_C [Gemmata massiliana]
MPPRLATRDLAYQAAPVSVPVAPVRSGPSVKALADAVSARVGATRFNLWFQGHATFVPHGDRVIVAARNQHTQEWLEHTFGAAVRSAVAEVYGSDTALRWTVEGVFSEETQNTEPEAPSEDKKSEKRGAEAARREDKKVAAASASDPALRASHSAVPQVDLFGDPVAQPKPKVKRPDPEAEALARPMASQRTGRRWKSLADFVSGPCNRVAHASGLSVVEEPGQGANPLVIHGPVGTGKTHLLEGIFAGLKRQSDQRPCYVTAEEFTTRFVQASRLGKMSAFRRQFRECTTLLLDDLHFLATKKATQEEFLHTFDALVADGRQVVVTTDCHPRLADELMPELLDRLLGGAVWGLLPPDPETRLEILRKKSCGAGPAIPDAVLKTLANTLRGNVRELEGAVNSLRHYAKVTGRPADMATAREALGDLLRHAVRVVTVADVDAAVCTTLRLAAGTLQSKARTWAVSHPRMVAIYLARKHTAATYGEVSKHFGAKTHSTAVAAEKKVREWVEKNASVAIGDREWPVKELIDRIERELQR